MGCGQSKIHLYPRKSKSKTNGKKSVEISSAEGDEDDAGTLTQEGTPSTDIENPIGSSPTPEKPHLGVILPPPEVSSSQLNFFRMLDEKIESGRDYDSSSETELALEEARMTALVKHWESASLSASACSSTSQGTPVKHSQTHRTTQEIQITPQPSRIPLYPPVYRGPPEIQTSVREIPSTLSLASRSGHPENIQIAPHQRDVLISQFQNARSIPEVVPKTKFDLTRINDNSFDESPNLSPVRHPRDQSNLSYSRDPIPTYSNVRNYAVQPLNAEYLEQRRNYVINVLPQSPVKTQRASPKLPDKGYNTNLLPQSVIHQSYGVNVAPARRLSQGNIPHCAHVTYYSQQMARIGPDGLLTPTNPPGKPTQPPQQNSALTHTNYHSTQMLGYVNPSKFYGVSDANQMSQRSQPSMSTFPNGAKLPPPIRQIPNDREQFFLDSNLCQNSQNIITYPTNISNNLVNINDLNRSPRVQTRKADNSFSGEMS